jgi:DNA-binding XRE family transcriptional regulator
MRSSLHNYLRTHRRSCGLYQVHVARLLGGGSETVVVRHERGQRAPNLETALGYAVILRSTVDELFAGVREDIEREVHERARVLLKEIGHPPAEAHLRGLLEDPGIHLVPCDE